jgi:voltage-gated potassium channel
MDIRVQHSLSTYFHRRRHTALLIAIAIAFAVRPLIGDAAGAPIVFSVALLALMLVALYTIQVDDLVGERDVLLARRRRQSIVGWVLAALAVVERLGVMIAPSPRLLIAGSIGWLLFFSFVTWSQLRSLLLHREVTRETISLSISVYLLLGMCWALLYIVIFLSRPEAFNLGAPELAGVLAAHPERTFPLLIYFSLTTLSTIGFGDITPVTLQARYAAVAEGITGQFYLAILVARLVGMQMSGGGRSDFRDATRPGEEHLSDFKTREKKK